MLKFKRSNYMRTLDSGLPRESYCMGNRESSTCKGRQADALSCSPLLKGKNSRGKSSCRLGNPLYEATKEYLDEKFESCTRRAILYKEYVKNISSSGMQSSCGFIFAEQSVHW